MSYDLMPVNRELDSFRFGAFSWGAFLEECCGTMFPCIHGRGKWYCSFGTDKRMPKGDNYPSLISNDGFKVTSTEAKMMARMARNYVALQRGLDDSHYHGGRFNYETPEYLKPWPRKIRADWVDKFEQFAEWAEKSKGFKIH